MEHIVKFGANTFIWASPFATATHLGLLDKAAAMGFDLLEVAVEDPALIDVPTLRRAAAEAGVGVLVCGAFGPDRNLSSAGYGRSPTSRRLFALVHRCCR
jgi:D-psicose/D-tagatose/L-ribulose 3-epimerase